MGVAMEPGEKLLRLLLHDERFIEAVMGTDRDNLETSELDPRTHAIIRLAALLALDAPSVVYQWNVDRAYEAGVTCDEIVGCLIAAAPVVGLPRVIAAAPDLAAMIGFDLDAALESPT
jgi:alkylhydroperoxidase/carboxymuconolactone decarboxylase family protein YurZ